MRRNGAVEEGKGAGGNGRAADAEKKSAGDLGGRRGRLISGPDRLKAVELIDEAHRNGARLFMACRELGITIRTRQRWLRGRGKNIVKEDGRKDAERRKPTGTLSDDERHRVLEIADSPEYASKPPAQIVADLADKGQWLASESTFYRILREKNQQHTRGKAKGPNRKAPASHGATAPDLRNAFF